MFSSLKKKDDEYKQNKIKYPILGLILGTTVGYYTPFVFLFTKFLSITAMGGIGGYTGNYINEKEVEECYYKKCAFDKYNDHHEKFKVKDYLFRKHMINNNCFDINYSYRNILCNIEDNEHIISKCYHDMIKHYKENFKDDIEKNTQKLLHFYFYHVCQYYVYLQDMDEIKEQIELEDISSWGEYNKINNTLLEVFDMNNEIFLKLYISIETIITDNIADDIKGILYDKYKDEDEKIMENKTIKLKEDCVHINYDNISALWLELFESNSPYKKMSIFYKININITEEIYKQTNKHGGADEIFPILIHSILLSENNNLYSEYMFFKMSYNYDIYNNIFEFLMVKYTSLIKYLLK